MNEIDPHKNDELDDLKSLWKDQPVEKSYGKDEIFKMIHRKSINSVQWLFIITIIELILGLGISLWTIFSGQHFYSDDTIKMVGEGVFKRMENLSHLGLLGSIMLMGIMFYFLSNHFLFPFRSKFNVHYFKIPKNRYLVYHHLGAFYGGYFYSNPN